MKVSVKECLQMDIFKEAKLITSEKNISNSVRDVAVLEGVMSEEIGKFYSYSEKMVLTGFFHVRDNEEEQCEIVKKLAINGCVALAVFHVGHVLPRIASSVIETAEEYKLPIIAFYDEALTASDFATKILSEFFYGKNFSNRLINNTIFHLLNFERYNNFQAAMKAAAINNDFQLVLASEDFNPIFSVETRHDVSIDDALLARRNFMNGDCSHLAETFLSVNGIITYWGPVTIKDDKYYLLIVDNGDKYSKSEITKLVEIIELAMGMWKYTPERDAKAEFIKALRRGNKSLAYTLKDEICIKGDEIVSVFYSKASEINVINTFLEEMEKCEGLKLIHGAEGDDVYGIILCEGYDPGTDKLSSARMKCNEMFNTLKGGRDILHIFHVTGVDGIEGAADAFRLIVETWSFVQAVFPHKHVFTKYEMVLVSNCINIQLQGNYVKRNYLDLLEPFKELGENKGKQLLDTLETFVLDARMNSARTSELMGIHTNTVQYRLKKITDVLGVEVTGNRVVPGLTLTLALRRLERVVR